MSNEFNPMKQDTGFDKVKGIFKKSDKDKNMHNNEVSECVCEFLGSNRAIDIISEACACCWDKKIPAEYTDRCEYVAKRSRTGHTSILEHSNFAVYLKVTGIYIPDLFKLMSWNRYLVLTTYVASSTDFRILMSGSLRGYSTLFMEADDLNNAVLQAILRVLRVNAPAAAFEDIAKLGLINLADFADYTYYPFEDSTLDLTTNYRTEVNEHFDVIGMDSIERLAKNLKACDPEMMKSINTRDLIKHVSITILFKNMSRIITQQLTRHRNGITQESQRYVDYSKASFNSPALFKENLDPEHKYSIRFGPSSQLSMNLQEIGDAMVGVYNMLHNAVICGAKYALVPEDARGYLPGNTQCRKVYITFHFDYLFKFFFLREAKGAQAEIRMYATEIAKWLRSHTVFTTKEITDLYTKPKLLVEDPFRFDEDEGIQEEVVEMTEEDYIRATGLDQELAAEEQSGN